MIATSHIRLALAALALAAAPVAFAHGSMKPKHGGIVTMSGETVVELVRNAQGVSVFVTEEAVPQAATSMTAASASAFGTRRKAEFVIVDVPRKRKPPAGACPSLANSALGCKGRARSNTVRIG